MGRPDTAGWHRGRGTGPLTQAYGQALVLLLSMSLAGCAASVRDTSGRGVCLDGSSRCAAAETPPDMRAELRGYRIRAYQWLRRHNRESGVPDVGIQAEWVPIRERR